MLTFIFALLLLVAALLVAVLRKTYTMVPAAELKRQAASGNQVARELFRAVGFGDSLGVLLRGTLILSLAGGSLLLAYSINGWLALFVLLVVFSLIVLWLPSTRVSSLSITITKWCNPVVVWLLHYGEPLLSRIAAWTSKHKRPDHSGLYEITDLLNLLDLQAGQADSRVTTEELALIRRVLQFGDQKVRDALQIRNQVKTVALDDAVGPVLLDELHASGQTSFPVKKTARSKEMVGTLYIGDVGIHSTGTVQDYATHGAVYIHESDSLSDALHVLYQTKHQLLIVVNSFDEYVGVLTLENILNTLVDGAGIDDEFDVFADRGAVVARHPRSNKS